MSNASISQFRAGYLALATAQKSSTGVSFYSRWVNRPAGRLLAASANVVGWTPNTVTLLSGLVSLAGMVLLVLVPPSPLTGVLVGFLLMLGFALDSADGQLARLRGGGSILGEWLDHLVDAGKTVLIHTAVLLSLWLHSGLSSLWLLVPLAYQFVAVVQFSGIMLTQFLEPKKHSSRPRQASNLRSLLLLPADYGILCVGFLTSGVLAVFIPVYSALAVLSTVITIGMILTWSRRLRS